MIVSMVTIMTWKKDIDYNEDMFTVVTVLTMMTRRKMTMMTTRWIRTTIVYLWNVSGTIWLHIPVLTEQHVIHWSVTVLVIQF